MASLVLLLDRARPGDWRVSPASGCQHRGSYALLQAAAIRHPATSDAVLDAILNSPGGFPVAAADPCVLHKALSESSASFVCELLRAGANPGRNPAAL